MLRLSRNDKQDGFFLDLANEESCYDVLNYVSTINGSILLCFLILSVMKIRLGRKVIAGIQDLKVGTQ